MSGKTIATIYFYLISAGAIILMVIGIFNIVNFIINSTQYEKYPLRYSGVSNCEFNSSFPGKPTPATSSAEIDPQAKERCLANEESERKLHRVDDMKNSVTFTLVGAILFLIHFPQAKKRSV